MKGTKGLFRSGAIASSMLLMIALSLMVLAGCDDGTKEPEGKTVTFTLAKASATSFTVTVDGADWNSDYLDRITQVLGLSDLTYTSYGYTGVYCILNNFDWVLSGKVVTATFKADANSSNLTGTLKLESDEVLSNNGGGDTVTDGGNGTGHGGTTTYVGKPAEGITF